MNMMQSHNATSKVELHIGFSNLRDLDLISHTDPMCAVYIFDKRSNQKQLLSLTECIDDTLTGKFTKSIILEYYFEFPQELIFEMYDVDDKDNLSALKNHDFIGSTGCNLADILCAPNQTFEMDLKKAGVEDIQGTISVLLEELNENAISSDLVFFNIKCCNIDPKNRWQIFRKSDPFIVINRSNESGEWTPVYKGSVIENTLDPVYPQFSLTVQTLCNGQTARPLRFDLFSQRSDGDHKYIGSVTHTLDELVQKGTMEPEVIWSQHKHDKLARDGKPYNGSGQWIFSSVRYQHCPSFCEYVTAGFDINLSVGIDFTGSNGNVYDVNGLHNISAGLSQYEMALRAVGSILYPYDRDRCINAFGFGAKIPDQLSHCFPLGDYTQNQITPVFSDIESLCAAYRQTVYTVQFYGPTMFSPILERVRTQAQNSRQSSYQLLLLLTDGQNNDMDAVVSEIVKASREPMSIIIVGIGNANFSGMNFLDADDGLLKDRRGNVAQRDIVQFVPFNKFITNPQLLASETLKEFPGQFLEYMRKNRIEVNSTLNINL
eukprot:TRINITY_DN231_c0_g1_i1.p1 TRINITY_DN231_c0_g1~~TRINITY_DN231_c0_g1_i1.p1  ORF type:complete len:547 (+),score=117.33 TRINITY_DN231_c0_g1_i1:77-1717(+)